ncbi:uncharacterized protein PHACADRAFT_212446 [Phanerochaete carnosa HHB-10118-sp]|uniref:Uncharacterized protein n=1 Tax=Phanerochaete carnosa (strain HHB-10118-sp) TaxID=650164 RepID=K5VYG8_PHACS|nr:uncharacterized protein PHACADRAFT_212446 [Phanerochaete carnosa HHB-10118-sp]EKM51830.1 hypothetical protein PHACADRAFT_212446 [Phanerochaete carnosa HHB-10118-sp]
MVSNTGVSELRALVDILQSTVDKLDETMASRGQTYPSLDDLYSIESEAPRSSPDVLALCDVLVSAAGQLIAAARPTPTSSLLTSLQYQTSACLRAVIRAHAAEVIREAGPKGLHISQIAKPTNMDPSKLARTLRLLATNHIFKEVAPDVFAHTRISSVLDTGKSLSEILEDPEAKHDGTSGMPALFEQLSDYSMKAAAYMPETLLDPSSAATGKTAFNRAYKTELSSFEWLRQPENAYIHRRFNMAMEGIAKMSVPWEALEGFDWRMLPEKSLVVDIGGGVGSQTLTLAKKFPLLNFVIQDTEATQPNAEKYWATRFPEAIFSGRVQYQVHNFFEPQPISSPAVYYLKNVLHDWSDNHCTAILRHLRDSAGPETKLVIQENIMEYVCGDSSLTGPGVSISSETEAHLPPLLPNAGQASMFTYYVDFVMMNTHGGVERTLPHFCELLADSGWKAVSLYKGPPGGRGKIIAIPQRVGVQVSGML